jgi:ferric-dicitrate binding protein FerR (iron transport regulator)
MKERLLDRLDRIRNTDVTELHDRVERSIAGIERRRRRFRVLKYAAVVVPLMIAGGMWLRPDRGGAGDATIARIVDRVVLTMPDGQEVALDDSLTVDDGAGVAFREGRFVYEDEAAQRAIGPLYTTLQVPRGQRFDMVLADGTHVWLNADSRLRFPLSFDGGERRVGLEGEGYFEVAHDGRKPFMVDVDGQSLRVLGTKFNISAYTGDGFINTSLLEGSVALEADAGAGLTLSPGSMARLDRGDPAAGYTTAPIKGDPSAWRNGQFLTDGKRLEQVFVELARWYDVEYSFVDRRAADLVLRGNLPIYDSIETIFEIIESSEQVTVETAGKRVKIRMR